jgi:hypothetical protein
MDKNIMTIGDMEDISANVIVGNYVTELHKVLNSCSLSKKERNKEICRIAREIYHFGYTKGCMDSGKDEQSF